MKPLQRAFLCIGVAWAGAAAQAASGLPAGTVTLTIGQATLITSGGESVSVKPGAVIRPGDRIETAAGGHVHVRFRDGGLVSVRPGSRLVVEDYRYDADRVADSTVRFRLESGAVRSISGAAAEGAKQRFRLNTPLVAIGVRGTDFVVQTSERQSFATVSQGAIVVAPLGEGCVADALGPCSTQAARLLAADTGGLLVELRDGMGPPEVRPTVAFQNPARAAEPSSAAKPGVPTDPAVQSGDAIAIAALNQERLADAATVSVPTPPAPSTLIWGRWGEPQGVADFSVPRDTARQQGQAVAYGWPYVLYRNQSEQASWPSQAGKVGFALQNATAQYRTAGGTQDVAVTAGSLTVDFAAARYRTQLQLAGVPYSMSNLTAAGVVGKDGTFNSSAVGQKVAGAVTLDAQAAAYWFQRASSSGIVSGITLWGR